MNPDYTTPQQKTRQLVLLLIGAMVLIIGLIALFSWLLSSKHSDYRLSALPFRIERNFAHLSGHELYSYNGLSFSKLNLENNQVTVLNKGTKLPVPNNMFWAGDRGILVDFSESFIATNVERKLAENSQIVDETTQTYTWYYNFADSSLTKVSDFPLNGYQAVYSSADKGFYYIPDLSTLGGTDSPEVANSQLHFFNLETKTDQEITGNLNTTGVESMKACKVGEYTLCAIGHDADGGNLHVYGINKNGQAKSLLESTGRIVPTSAPDGFITTGQEADSTINELDDAATYEPAPAVYHNLSNNSTIDLGFSFGDEPIVPHIVSATDFYVLNVSDNSTYLSGGRNVMGSANISEQQVKLADGKDFEGSFTSKAEFGDNSTVLVTDVDGSQYLFAPLGKYQPVTSLDKKTAQTIVDNCVKTSASATSEFNEDAQQFRIYLQDNENFSQSIAAFSDCALKANNQTAISYGFYFGGLDPGNGRYTTD